ncbi:MAG: methionyl-tRNA formyltransferase [Gammaproteobacteria bacterium]
MTGPSRRIIFAGTPDFAAPSLAALLAASHEIVAVLTQPDRPAGRGRKTRPGPVKRLAVEHGLPVLQPTTLKDSDVQQDLNELAPDLMVVVAYGLLLPPAVLTLPAHGCINVHASLLPRWRGAAPIQAAVRAGDARTGVCLMQLEAGLDTGPVFACAGVDIGPRETAGELHDRLAGLGASLLGEKISAILSGELVAQPQSADGVSYAGRIQKSDARLNWHASAVELDRQIRAYAGWPVADTLLDGQQLRVWQAEPVDRSFPAAVAGEVVDTDNEGLLVQTGDGVLSLREVQLAGRGRIRAADFALGYPVTAKRLGS